MFLDRIVTQTRADLAQRKQEVSLAEIQRRAAAQPQTRDLAKALRPDPTDTRVRVIAEVKKASPSKGLLAPDLDPVTLARTYEANGASAISVLTEPHFFLGSPDYLAAIKQAVSVPVLCKDFILDPYQVYEARSWGADAILLICAILDDTQLRELIKVANDQRMRCLVETHNADEVRRAVAAGAVVIGVNSRDLKTFQMNPHLLRQLRPLIPADCVVIAESGIHSAADARRLARYDVQAMLVGESLVVSRDVPGQLHMLLAGANASTQVKICGLKTAHHLHAALDAGTDLCGFMFYEPSHRYISPAQARELLSTRADGQTGAEVVGVFVNKEPSYMNDVTAQVGLDIVQLHGDESPELCQQISRPVIKALHLSAMTDLGKLQAYQEATWRLLLDTPTPGWGGSGEKHDWGIAAVAAQQARVILAGGLTPENVAEAIRQVRPWGVDVSSGVETNKEKDEARIRAFIEQVRGALY